MTLLDPNLCITDNIYSFVDNTGFVSELCISTGICFTIGLTTADLSNSELTNDVVFTYHWISKSIIVDLKRKGGNECFSELIQYDNESDFNLRMFLPFTEEYFTKDSSNSLNPISSMK
jgi:hypothetical protein